jgi:hypothetical protein
MARAKLREGPPNKLNRTYIAMGMYLEGMSIGIKSRRRGESGEPMQSMVISEKRMIQNPWQLYCKLAELGITRKSKRHTALKSRFVAMDMMHIKYR